METNPINPNPNDAGSYPLFLGKMFTCPECEQHLLEEILTGVTVRSCITKLNKPTDGSSVPDVQYENDPAMDDGELSSIQCFNCGEQIADDFDDLIEKIETNEGNMWSDPPVTTP